MIRDLLSLARSQAQARREAAATSNACEVCGMVHLDGICRERPPTYRCPSCQRWRHEKGRCDPCTEALLVHGVVEP